MRTLFSMILAGGLLAIAATLATARPADPAQPAWYAKAVKSIEAKVEPAEAKPGQTVTVKVTVVLNPGHYTYATKQTDKIAIEFELMNGITFPPPGGLVFVGELADPPNPKTKAMPEIGVKSLKYYSGTVTFERKAVVAPGQKPGDLVVKIPEFKLNVCNQNDCFPVKKIPLEATVKVLDGPAVSVDAQYVDEVKKALEKK